MRNSRIARCSMLIATLMITSASLCQAHGQAAPRVVTVKLVDKAGGQFAFEPAVFDVHRGDTLHFVQASRAPHNVHFRTTPPGAKLGKAASSPYLIAPNAIYDVAIDNRFVDGAYGIICDPHESVGMRASMTVVPPEK